MAAHFPRKSIAQVFNKLFHQTSSTASTDAHLKNQDRFYDADFQQGFKASLSQQNTSKSAIVRARQRSLYFNPKQNAQETQNQTRTGIKAARDYFALRKGISLSSLPTVEELFSAMMKSRIMSR